MTGPMQRIFSRRASGSSDRGGFVNRITAPLRRRGRATRAPWGKRAAAQGAASDQTTVAVAIDEQPGFRERGRLRRRLRYLRRARELAYRDVGGLIFDMRRFNRDRPDLVDAKLSALDAVDRELRALERILDARRPLHELREPGISSCARCGALHSSEANFCPHCGLQLGGPRAMGEVGGAIAAPPQAPQAPPAPAGHAQVAAGGAVGGAQGVLPAAAGPAGADEHATPLVEPPSAGADAAPPPEKILPPEKP